MTIATIEQLHGYVARLRRTIRPQADYGDPVLNLPPEGALDEWRRDRWNAYVLKQLLDSTIPLQERLLLASREMGMESWPEDDPEAVRRDAEEWADESARARGVALGDGVTIMGTRPGVLIVKIRDVGTLTLGWEDLCQARNRSCVSGNAKEPVPVTWMAERRKVE